MIVGGAGGDRVFGESGNDFFHFTHDGLGNGFDFIDGGSGRDTLYLRVSSGLFAAQDFKQELQDFATFLDVSPAGEFTFDLLDLTVRSVERVEVIVGSRTVDTVGPNTANPNAVLAAALRDGDLWGMV
jgi:hypothetical protein